MHRIGRWALLYSFVAVLLAQTGCRRTHFTVQSAPSAPEHLGAYKVEKPEVPAIVQIVNFTIGTVDTQYPNQEKELFRTHYAVAIPNLLQETLGKRQVFTEVTRTQAAVAGADYTVSGEYSLFERLGTGGREWIPFAGTFGAKINEAWIKGTMSVRVTSTATGSVILQKSYVEEHRDRTSVYTQPKVGYLQADHVAAIAQDIINAVEADQRVTPSRTRPTPDREVSQPAAREVTSLEDRLRMLERLRRDGLISDAEYQQRRRVLLDREF